MRGIDLKVDTLRATRGERGRATAGAAHAFHGAAARAAARATVIGVSIEVHTGPRARDEPGGLAEARASATLAGGVATGPASAAMRRRRLEVHASVTTVGGPFGARTHSVVARRTTGARHVAGTAMLHARLEVRAHAAASGLPSGARTATRFARTSRQAHPTASTAVRPVVVEVGTCAVRACTADGADAGARHATFVGSAHDPVARVRRLLAASDEDEERAAKKRRERENTGPHRRVLPASPRCCRPPHPRGMVWNRARRASWTKLGLRRQVGARHAGC